MDGEKRCFALTLTIYGVKWWTCVPAAYGTRTGMSLWHAPLANLVRPTWKDAKPALAHPCIFTVVGVNGGAWNQNAKATITLSLGHTGTPHLLSELSHVGELRPDGLVLHPYMSGISEKTGTWYQNGDIEITGFGMSVVGTWRASSGVRVGSAEHPASAFRNLCCQGVLLGARRQCLLDPQRNGRLRCVPGMLFFLDPTRSSSEKMEMTTQYTRYLNDSTPWKQLGNQPIFNVTGTSSQGR